MAEMVGGPNRARLHATQYMGNDSFGSFSVAELPGWRRQVLPRDRPPWRVTTASASGQ
jgi:hypothetical protein